MAGWMHGPAPGPDTQPPRPHLPVSRQFTAADDKGTSYMLRFSTRITGSAALAGVLDLRPDPQHEIRWLDLRPAPGEPATRIHLDTQDPAPDITVTKTAASPGRAAGRRDRRPGPRPGIDPPAGNARAAGCRKAGASAACGRLARGRHHRAAGRRRAGRAQPGSGPARRVVRPPGHQRPRHHHAARRRPAGPVAEHAHPLPSPETICDARAWQLGRHSGRTARAGRCQGRRPRRAPRQARHHPAPARGRRHDGGRLGVLPGSQALAHPLGPRQRGRWHATNHYAPRPLGDNGEVTLDLAIAPPLEAGTPWIDMVAAGQSAEVRARLPLRWTWNP